MSTIYGMLHYDTVARAASVSLLATPTFGFASTLLASGAAWFFPSAQARQKEQLKKHKFKTTCRNLTIVLGIVTILIIWLVLAFNGKGVDAGEVAPHGQVGNTEATGDS